MRVALTVALLVVLSLTVAAPAEALVACADLSNGAPRLYVHEGSSCTEGSSTSADPAPLVT